MPCDTRLKPRQTLAQRAEEVKKRAARIAELLAEQQRQRLLDAKARIGIKIGPTGAIVFTGLTAEERDGMTDGCIYRMLKRSGSAAARQAITRAEMVAGVKVNERVIAQGTHSHDGGHTWHGRG